MFFELTNVSLIATAQVSSQFETSESLFNISLSSDKLEISRLISSYFRTSELDDFYEDSRRSLAIYNLLDNQKRLHKEKPKIGDLVFFANTVKQYSKTKSDDNITHIGIVTKIDPDETIYFIHNTRGKNVISQMNLNYPGVS